jgi:MFS family permease
VEHARRNVFLLACCQALLLTNAVTLIAISSLAGYAIAETKVLATLPATTYVLGGALGTFPASMWMKRVGRRHGFLTGGCFGLLGSMVAALAMGIANFWLLCMGTFLLGIYNAFGQYYRFAAADAAPPDFKAKAISLVLAGGLVGGLIGPEVSKHTIDLMEPRFMAAYASLFGFCLAAMGIVSFLAIPPIRDEGSHEGARPLSEIVRQPVFIVAAACAGLGYGVMTLLMTATPLAMGFCGYPYAASAGVIAAHVIAMFAPSFFTGTLIQRFGVLQVILAGVLIELGCVAVALSGQQVANFWWALVLLGLGWNFTYVGGTTLLTEAYRPAEKAKTQGLNEFIIFGVQAVASLSSGVLVNTAGWTTLNYFSMPLLAAAGIATTWLMLRRRAARAAA